MCAAKVYGSWTSYFKFPWDEKKANQQKNFEELCSSMTRPQFFSFEPPVFMEPHSALSLHTCTILALCLLQQCVVTPPRLDGKVLPSLVFLPKLMFQSFYAKLELSPEKQSEASALNKPVVLPVVLIRDPTQFLFFSSCLWTSTSVHFFLTLPGFQ